MKLRPFFRHVGASAGWVCAWLAFVCFLPGPAKGASTQIWEISEYKDFIGGKFEGISLRHDGRLVPAPRLETVFSSEQPIVWCAATSRDGSIYLGTGHQGHVYRVDARGKSKLFWKAPEVEVFAIAVAPDGVVYAGTSPHGKVYRFSKDGESEVLFDPEETYIWSLVFAGQGNGAVGLGGAAALFVGTGDQGKIYRVDSGGKGEVYYETGQRHVVSMAIDREGLLLAGTDPNGILYRVERKGKAFALYDSDLPEIRGLEVGPEGEIYAAAMGGGASQITQSVPATAFSTTTSVSPGVTLSVSPGSAPDLGKPKTDPAKGQAIPQGTVTIVQPVISYAGMEKAALLRVGSDLSVRKLWTSKQENLLALRRTDFDDLALLFATDHRGRIYGLNDEREVTLVADVDQEQVTQLIAAGPGLILTTAHSGKLFRLDRGRAARGVYQSPIHDAKSVSRWGRLSWREGGRDGASTEFHTRSGNSARPDSTWSEWAEPQQVQQGPWTSARIESPPARYVQWRATLNGSNQASPELHGVRVTYLPQNQAPVIDSITFSTAAPTGGSGSTTAASGTGTNASSTSAFSITVTDTGEVTASDSSGTKAKTIRGGSREVLKIHWQAYDPDGDELTAAVAFRGEGETAWKTIKKDLKDKELGVDSDALADGTYRFRVRVSDSRANPPDQALVTRRVSEPVVIDHTPPLVRVLSREGRATVRFEAEDQASMLQQADYSIDAGPWVPVRADDGIVDSLQEAFSITIDNLKEGEHLITLRVRDRAGNAGLGKVVVP